MRKIKDEFEARACLTKVAASGRPLAVWARGHGIDGRSLNSWKTNMERRGTRRRPPAPSTKPRFVEIVARTEALARYVVIVGDVRVEVDDSFRAETLSRLVAALRAC
jgi:hypothetical protein